MIINKRPDNIMLTYCNLCGSFVGGGGRLNLTVTFDEGFVYNDEYLNSSISANICPRCANKLVQTIENDIARTEEIVTEAKVKIGLDFNSVISAIYEERSMGLQAPVEKIVEEPVTEIITEEAMVFEDEEPEISINPVTYPNTDENDLEITEKEETSDFSVYDEYKEKIESFCEEHKGTIKDEQEFIDDFSRTVPVFNSILHTKTDEECMDYIRKIIRDNCEFYRLKMFAGKWYIHFLKHMKEVHDSNIECEVKTDEVNTSDTAIEECNESEAEINFVTRTFENPVKGNRSKGTWTEEEMNFLLEKYAEYGPEYCSEKLGRTCNACYTKYNKLTSNTVTPIKCSNTYKIWTEEDEKFLIENYKKLGELECSKQLNTTPGSCRSKYNRLVNQ